MSFSPNTGEYKTTRGDVFMVDPRALVIDWKKNVSRNGETPPVDDSLIDLARDMIPHKGSSDSEDGSSGQLNPIIVRPLPDRRLEVTGGFRRARAGLWLIESGECPDFKIKCLIRHMNDAEAALANICENIQREDPKPIQLAHAVRCLTEHYGMPIKDVAGRLKRSVTWITSLLDLVMLPAPIQESVANGELGVSAAIELAKLQPETREEAFEELASSGDKITIAKVREKRQKAHEKTGEGNPVPCTLKQFKIFLESRTALDDPGRDLAFGLLEFLAGKKTDDHMIWCWTESFQGKQ